MISISQGPTNTNTISKIFSDRILNELDCMSLILHSYYKKDLIREFPDQDITPTFSCYTELISKIYEEFEEDKEECSDPMESKKFQCIEKFIEISELIKIKQKSKIERFLTFCNEYKDPHSSFIESNFITSLFPEPKEELEE